MMIWALLVLLLGTVNILISVAYYKTTGTYPKHYMAMDIITVVALIVTVTAVEWGGWQQ